MHRKGTTTITALTLKTGSCKPLAYKALLSLKKALLIHTNRIGPCSPQVLPTLSVGSEW